MFTTVDSVRWLLTALLLYLIGYELGTQTLFLVGKAGAEDRHIRHNADSCCYQLGLYVRFSGVLALVAAVLGLLGIPFTDVAIWSIVMWGVATLYALSRAAYVLTAARHDK